MPRQHEAEGGGQLPLSFADVAADGVGIDRPEIEGLGQLGM